jgi:hypothetical protein
VRPVSAEREDVRRGIADHFLAALDALVRRHRALAGDGRHEDLHAELIAAEVAHELALARRALHRHPSLRSAR